MKVLVLAPALYDTVPGQRFRIEQWARLLAPEGIEFTFLPFEDAALHEIVYQPKHHWLKAALILRAFGRRLGMLAHVRDFDAVYICREAALVGPAFVESLVARQRVPVVFDFDDAIWLPNVSAANRRFGWLKWFRKVGAICRLSTHIIAGNAYLANYARKHNPRVTIIPTTIDTDFYTVGCRHGGASRAPVTIGWTGSQTTVQYLDRMRTALVQLGRRHEFRLHVIGAPGYSVNDVETIAQAWQVESEVRDLQQFDIGLVPLPDDCWTRGKCAMKLLQYMATGTPAVGSRVQTNTDVIQEGVNGFSAESEDEWVQRLSLLISDEPLRRKMGLAGRRTVEERYSARVWAPRVRQVLESAAASR